MAARPEHREASIEAIGSGADEWLEIAGTAIKQPDPTSAAVPRRGIQVAMNTNAKGVLRLVSRGTIGMQDACGPNAPVPAADASWATCNGVHWFDMRIDRMSTVDEPDRAALAADCEKELRPERQTVLAKTAARQQRFYQAQRILADNLPVIYFAVPHRGPPHRAGGRPMLAGSPSRGCSRQAP